MAPILGIIAGSIQKAFAAFSDNFNRTTSGSLGTSSSGGLWQSIRGTWFANGSQAQSNDAASTYPIAAVAMSKSSHTITANTPSNGVGLAFWVADSGSWWAIANQREDTGFTYSCNCATNYYSCNCATNYYSCNCATNYYSCNCTTNYYSCNCQTCNTCCQAGPYGCTKYCSTSCNCQTCSSQSCGTCSSYSCSTCSSYSCQTCSSYGCQTCSSYACQTCNGTNNNYYLRLLRSVAGTVSQISQVSLGANTYPNSIYLNTTAGMAITARSYSGANQSSQLGSDLTYTASGFTPATKAGVILTPSPAGVGTTIDDYSATSI